MRLSIRVRPGAGRTVVGGRHGDHVLVVAVRERAVDGAATESALKALAQALGLRRRQVLLVTGRTARTKVVELTDPPAGLDARIRGLLEEQRWTR